MKPTLRFALITAISLAAVSAAAAQEKSWVGKTILIKKIGIKIGNSDANGKPVFTGELTALDYKVLGDKDGWLQVNDGRGNLGWFDKADAVLLDNAVAFFTERVGKDAKDANPFNSRGTAYQLKGDFDNAIKDFSEAVRLDPRPYAYNNRGNAWRDKKDYDKAITDYNEAIRLDAKWTAGYYNRGLAWEAKKVYDKALADYNETIQLDSKYILAYNNRAWVWATCPNAKYRDGKKAVESAKHALASDPKNSDWMDTLAAAYAESGDFVEAVRWQMKAMEDPEVKGDPDARRRLELYRAKKAYRQE